MTVITQFDAAPPPDTPPAVPANGVSLQRRRERVLAAADPRRRAAAGDARHLPLLAVTDVRRALWNNTEIAGDNLEYIGTARELLLGFLIAIALLVPVNAMFFLAALSGGVIGQMAGTVALRGARGARAVRGLSRAPLSSVAHGLSRHPLPPDRLGDALRGLRDLLVGDDRRDARARLSVRAGEPRALQAAQHLLRRPAGRVHRLGLAAVLSRHADVDRRGRAARCSA